MSIETWKAEFYPTNPRKRMTKLEAIEHSLKKYEGTTKNAMAKHKVMMAGGMTLEDDNLDSFSFDAETCALCVKYMDRNYGDSCYKCPLKMAAGRDCLHPTSEYEKFCVGDNRPMLKLLRGMLRREQGRIK